LAAFSVPDLEQAARPRDATMARDRAKVLDMS
jgi:hypothetical protein